MPVEVVNVSRESVTLSWSAHPAAFGYTIRRLNRVDDVMHDELRAVVYEGLYCDPGLQAGTEYLYEMSSIPDPDNEPPDEPIDVQRVRIRTLPELEYPDLGAFFADFIAPTFRRRLAPAAYRWCPHWRQHPEVRYALEQLWHAYEAMRPPEHPQPPGKIRMEWLILFAWPVLERLAGQEGPMHDCYLDDESPDGRHVGDSLAEVKPLPNEAPTIAP